LRQPVHQRLLLRSELFEAFGFQLNETGGPYTIDQSIGGVQPRGEKESYG